MPELSRYQPAPPVRPKVFANGRPAEAEPEAERPEAPRPLTPPVEEGVCPVVVVGPAHETTPFLILTAAHPSGVRVAGLARSLADAREDLANEDVRAVIVSTATRDFKPEALREFAHWPARPLAVIALVPGGGTLGAELLGQGASATYNTPVTEPLVDLIAQELPGLVTRAAERWRAPLIEGGADGRFQLTSSTPYRTGAIAFWSSKGGDGKTTLAHNVALILSQIGQQRVLVIDADMNIGRICYQYGIDPQDHTIWHLAADYAAGGNRLTREMLARRVEAVDRVVDPRTRRPDDRLSVLFGITATDQGSTGELAGEQGRHFMRDLVDLARTAYDFVILDLGSNMQLAVHYQGLVMADKVMFINTSDRSSLLTNRNMLARLMQSGELDPRRVQLVINRWSEEDGLLEKDVVKWAAMPVAALIPEDLTRELMSRLNRMKPGERPFILEYLAKPGSKVERTVAGMLTLAAEIFPPLESYREARVPRRGFLGGLFGAKARAGGRGA